MLQQEKTVASVVSLSSSEQRILLFLLSVSHQKKIKIKKELEPCLKKERGGQKEKKKRRNILV